MIITGPTGCAKSFLACAFALKACLAGHTALHKRAQRRFVELSVARADGSYGKLLQKFARVQRLVVDDWGVSTLGEMERRDFLEILEDRYNTSSTIMTSPVPINQWHDTIGDPTLAGAILDRVVHNAQKIRPEEESGKNQGQGRLNLATCSMMKNPSVASLRFLSAFNRNGDGLPPDSMSTFTGIRRRCHVQTAGFCPDDGATSSSGS